MQIKKILMKCNEMRDTRFSLPSFRLLCTYPCRSSKNFALAYITYRQRLSKTRNKSCKLEVEDNNAVATAL